MAGHLPSDGRLAHVRRPSSWRVSAEGYVGESGYRLRGHGLEAGYHDMAAAPGGPQPEQRCQRGSGGGHSRDLLGLIPACADGRVAVRIRHRADHPVRVGAEVEQREVSGGVCAVRPPVAERRDLREDDVFSRRSQALVPDAALVQPAQPVVVDYHVRARRQIEEALTTVGRVPRDRESRRACPRSSP